MVQFVHLDHVKLKVHYFVNVDVFDKQDFEQYEYVLVQMELVEVENLVHYLKMMMMKMMMKVVN